MTSRRPKKLIWSMPLLVVVVTCLHGLCPDRCHAQLETMQDSAGGMRLKAPANVEVDAPDFEQERIKSINSRIKLLKSILEEEKNRQMSQAIPAPAQPRPSPPADQITPAVLEVPSRPKTGVAQQALIESDVATSAINSFELGYSLFMTGNFKAASNTFKELLKSRQPPEETAWLQCLIGCCDRLQQDFGRAETRFRNTVDQKRAPNVTARHANWNLQYIAQRKQATETMKQVSQQLEQILKEIENAR